MLSNAQAWTQPPSQIRCGNLLTALTFDRTEDLSPVMPWMGIASRDSKRNPVWAFVFAVCLESVQQMLLRHGMWPKMSSAFLYRLTSTEHPI